MYRFAFAAIDSPSSNEKSLSLPLLAGSCAFSFCCSDIFSRCRATARRYERGFILSGLYRLLPFLPLFLGFASPGGFSDRLESICFFTAFSSKGASRRDPDSFVLNGTKTLISNGGLADFYVVFATVGAAKPRAISAFLVDAHNAGLEFVRPLVMSSPHPLGEIAFHDCRVNESALIGKEGTGLKLALSTLDRLRATVGAAACGMAARALSEAILHAQTRHQFGKPLADLQLIQDKIARMAIRLRAARLLVYEAAWEKDKGAERVTLESGMAKAFATENAQTIIDDAVQILGGRGVLKESMVDLLYRSVRSLRIYEGTTEIQHLLIAAQLLKPRS